MTTYRKIYLHGLPKECGIESLSNEITTNVNSILSFLKLEGVVSDVFVRRGKVTDITEEACRNLGNGYIKLSLTDADARIVADELCKRIIGGSSLLATVPAVKTVAQRSDCTKLQDVSNELKSKRQEKRLQCTRRKERHIHRLCELIAEIPSPGGLNIFENYVPLMDSNCSGVLPMVDWTLVPRSLDPGHNFVQNVPLGNNLVNEERVRSKGAVDTPDDDSSSGAGELFDCPVGRSSALCGDLTTRAVRKRCQAESFLVLLRQLTKASNGPSSRSFRVVDFGSGTGNLSLPLAYMFPEFEFIAVDMKAKSIAILLERAEAAGLRNVRGVCGTIEEFNEPFDVSLALHACGQATDFALWQAERCRAAYIVCPCCIGALKNRKTSDLLDLDTLNAPVISHPRSLWLFNALGTERETFFASMAKTGDISHGSAHSSTIFNRENEEIARMCKCHLEMDRNCRMQEVNYTTALTSILKSELTSKGDLLVGVPKDKLLSGAFNWPWIIE